MTTFIEVCSQLGVPIADDKTDGPSTRITYLGLLIDTEKMLIQIPEEKVQELNYKKKPLKFSKNIFHVNISLCIAFVIFIKW
jgi:hypothetical protein